jgi:hypothetical protein
MSSLPTEEQYVGFEVFTAVTMKTAFLTENFTLHGPRVAVMSLSMLFDYDEGGRLDCNAA